MLKLCPSWYIVMSLKSFSAADSLVIYLILLVFLFLDTLSNDLYMLQNLKNSVFHTLFK